MLLDQLTALGEAVPTFDPPLFKFTKFGVIVRYDSGVPLTQAERQQYRKIVEDLRTFVTTRVDLLP